MVREVKSAQKYYSAKLKIRLRYRNNPLIPTIKLLIIRRYDIYLKSQKVKKRTK